MATVKKVRRFLLDGLRSTGSYNLSKRTYYRHPIGQFATAQLPPKKVPSAMGKDIFGNSPGGEYYRGSASTRRPNYEAYILLAAQRAAERNTTQPAQQPEEPTSAFLDSIDDFLTRRRKEHADYLRKLRKARRTP